MSPYKITSLQLFRSHLTRGEDGMLEASQIHSRACYLQWVDNRKTEESDEELKKFQRARELIYCMLKSPFNN
jgi:bifunctional pyridoxal-dependent enzyme with beta-cystathionase and maltose regulon repressor activities